ncbi:MAG: Rrf2 family transcriptional regulator [Deltaproteobacteria bacterium]|nr:Rrf2 family transcriptional regulator [Deltaproteobacteria bacterium]
MLKISDAVNLAFHAMIILATNQDASPMSVAWMAKRLRVSDNHLAKVMQRLHKIGLVNSKRGPKGGFTLGRPAETIRLLDVFESIEGPISERECLLTEPMCNGACCLLGGLLGSINNQVRTHLESTTLSHVCAVMDQTPGAATKLTPGPPQA